MVGRGVFITFEGGEGAGKTTLIHRLASTLRERGHDLVLTREPGGCPLAEEVRQLLLAHRSVSVNAIAEPLFFLAARAQNIQEIIAPALFRGSMVLCDRFNDSTIAYQGFGRELGATRVKNLCQLACPNPRPNLTFLLDIPPELGLQRAIRKGATDRIEAFDLAFHERVRQGYLTLQQEEPHRIRMIDATLSPDEVYRKALEAIDGCLESRGTLPPAPPPGE